MTEPRKTPRTDAEEWFIEVRGSRFPVVYSPHARILEIETQELAEALELARGYVYWSDEEGRQPEDYPEAAALIASHQARIDAALASHRAKQEGSK